MDEKHPALAAARTSWRCVQARDKEGWLGAMADDILVEDPIGKGPTNPDGRGIRGKQALAAFFDANIAPNTIRIETHASFAAGDESAHRMTLRTTFPNGTTMVVDGIFTYAVDAAGLLTRLRGYWALEDATFEKPADG
jgi:steroid delta-isomerase